MFFKTEQVFYELEKISTKDLKKYRKRNDQINSYLKEHYHYFAGEREKVFGQLKKSLLQQCETFGFKHLQRAVSFKYSDNPLSAKGSVISVTGGRFNLGDISPNLPRFAGLYLAEEKETAIREAFQIPATSDINGLTSEELALIRQKSFSILNVQGNIELILDLTKKENLAPFYSSVKHIKLPNKLVRKAAAIKVYPQPEIKNLSQLYATIFELHFRKWSMMFDLPSNSQILSHIAYEAGIQGILYSSKFTGCQCIVIYPRNFQDSSAIIRISKEEVPLTFPEQNLEINYSNFQNFI